VRDTRFYRISVQGLVRTQIKNRVTLHSALIEYLVLKRHQMVDRGKEEKQEKKKNRTDNAT
jgi:hypothetical protein